MTELMVCTQEMTSGSSLGTQLHLAVYMCRGKVHTCRYGSHRSSNSLESECVLSLLVVLGNLTCSMRHIDWRTGRDELETINSYNFNFNMHT